MSGKGTVRPSKMHHEEEGLWVRVMDGAYVSNGVCEGNKGLCDERRVFVFEKKGIQLIVWVWV